VRDRLRPDLRIHLATAEAEFWESPDFSRVSMPPGFPDALRRTAKRFLKEYGSQLRPFETGSEVAPGLLVQRTGGHTPGHSVVRLASRGDRLMFAGDAVFQVGFEHPDWFNGFEHNPEEAARVRVRLLRELAANRESLVATHLSFPSRAMPAVGSRDRFPPQTKALLRPQTRVHENRRDFTQLGSGRQIPSLFLFADNVLSTTYSWHHANHRQTELKHTPLGRQPQDATQDL